MSIFPCKFQFWVSKHVYRLSKLFEKFFKNHWVRVKVFLIGLNSRNDLASLNPITVFELLKFLAWNCVCVCVFQKKIRWKKVHTRHQLQHHQFNYVICLFYWFCVFFFPPISLLAMPSIHSVKIIREVFCCCCCWKFRHKPSIQWKEHFDEIKMLSSASFSD